jgi:NitT/TauT family transport system substrate-binding protein
MNRPLSSTRRRWTQAAALALAALGALPTAVLAQTPVKFQLDWRFEGPAALFLARRPRATSRPPSWT